MRLNQPHPARVTPSWYGDSVGHYEGDTLVIDTVGVKADRPFAMVDMYGTPFSPAMHVVERYRLIDYSDAKGAIERNSKENIRFYEEVYALHHITKKQFDYTYKYYESHPIEFKILLDSIDAFAVREQARVNDATIKKPVAK